MKVLNLTAGRKWISKQEMLFASLCSKCSPLHVFCFFPPSSRRKRGGGEWKFIFVLKFPLGCFRVPAIYPTPANISISLSIENTKNQKMIQMTSRKNESSKQTERKLSLFILPMNLNRIAEWRRRRMEWDGEGYSIGKDDFQQMKGNGI